MSEFFGIDVEGWNLDTDGKVGIAHFANALQVWSACQGRDVTVEEAATAFNCDPRMIVEAAEWHSWMDIDGPSDDYSKLTIYHEGE